MTGDIVKGNCNQMFAEKNVIIGSAQKRKMHRPCDVNLIIVTHRLLNF